jgi:AmmeMemoRadiSam system protein B
MLQDNNTSVRQPAVAGMFYPGNPAELLSQIQQYLDAAETDQTTSNTEIPKAIVAPHAGYIYSGPVAAMAYAQLAPARSRIKRVILLGPSHRVAFYGCAVSSAQYFHTPLGDIPLDRKLIDDLLEKQLVKTMDEAHALEHSLEVQLPFLQVVLEDFTLVPVVVGDATPKEVGALLDATWGGPETLIVISSDLSHYHSYDTARQIDLATCRIIENLDYQHLSSGQACGFIPVRGLMYLSQQRHLHARTIDYRNSGDTAGPRDQVVGYGAYAFN